MRNRTFRTVFFAPFFICVLSTCSSPEIGVQQEFDLPEIELYLGNAEIVDVEEGADLGTTDPWNVSLDDGKTKKRARFKHAPRCRPNFLVDCYKYEVAAYELSKMLSLPIVPPTVERSVKDTPGALSIFLEGITPLNRLKDIPDTASFHRNMLDILVFDNLTYWQTGMDDINEDILYHNDDGRIFRVDFSKAFDNKHELLGVEREVKQCSDSLYRALEQLDETEVHEKLSAYLNEDEIAALLARRDLLLADLTPRK